MVVRAIAALGIVLGMGAACSDDDGRSSAIDAGAAIDAAGADALGGDAAPICLADFADCQTFEDRTAATRVVEIKLRDTLIYEPRCVRLKVGQAFSIQASTTHPMEVMTCSPEDFTGGGANTTNEYALDTPGLYAFQCTAHGEDRGMRGMIEIVAE